MGKCKRKRNNQTKPNQTKSIQTKLNQIKSNSDGVLSPSQIQINLICTTLRTDRNINIPSKRHNERIEMKSEKVPKAKNFLPLEDLKI